MCPPALLAPLTRGDRGVNRGDGEWCGVDVKSAWECVTVGVESAL